MSDVLPQKPLTLPVPANETERLVALHRYRILDTPPEAAFDRITRLAARLLGLPITLISLVDESRAWFKSSIGLDVPEVARDATLCSFALLTDEPLIVPDTRLDDRFACNPFVQSEPGVRFYAGAPLLSHDGFNLGTLCLLDSQPHASLTEEQQATLVDLAAMVVDELELRLAAQKVAQVDTALLKVTQGVATTTGEAFLDALVQHLAAVLDTDYVYIGLVEGEEPKRMRTITTYAHGQIVENLEYLLQDTPCWEVLEQRKICCHPRNVQAEFPHAPLLQPLRVESYIAAPFFDSNGAALGLLGVMDGQPLENVHLAQSLLMLFADRIATELERQRFEQQRDRFFAISSDLQVITGNNGYFQWVSPTFERILGWTQDDMVARPWTEFVHPDDIDTSVTETASLFAGNETFRFENRYRHKDGSYRWFLWNAQPNLEEQVLYGAAIDITERKQAETALQASEAFNRSIVRSSADCIKVLDLNGCLLTLNSAGRCLLEVEDCTRLIGSTWVEFWQEPDRISAVEAIATAAAGGTGRFSGYCPTLRGTPKWWDVMVTPILDSTGKPKELLVVSRDITERKRTEEALRESEEKYRTLFDSIDEGFCTQEAIYDEDGNVIDFRYLEVNRVFERQSGMVDPVGKTLRDFVPNIEQFFLDANVQVLQTGEPLRYENYAATIERWFSVYVSRVGGEGSRLIAAVFDNITDRKQREADERFLSDLGELIRTSANEAALTTEANELIARHFDLKRCYLVDVDEERDVFRIENDFHADLPSLAGEHTLSAFPPVIRDVLRHCELLVSEDAKTDSRSSAFYETAYKPLQIRGHIVVPMLRDNRFAALLAAISDQPRQWQPREINLLETAAERLLLGAEKLRREQALRESEERLRRQTILLNTVNDNTTELIFMKDLQGRMTYCNAATLGVMGATLEEFISSNNRVRFSNPDEIAPIGVNDRRVVETGETIVFEEPYTCANGDQRIFLSTKSPLRDDAGKVIGVIGVSRDITDRKQRETHLAFLAEIQDDCARLTTVDALMQTVGAKIGSYLNLSVCAFVDIDEAQDRAIVPYSWHRADASTLAGTYRISEFVSEEFYQAARASEVVVVNNTDTDARTNAETCAAINVRSFIHVPLLNDGQWKFLFNGYDSRPREWRADEVELFSELANRVFFRLERARAEVAVAADLQDTQRLRDLSTRLILEDDIQVLFNEIVATAIAISQADVGTMQLLDPQTHDLILLTTQGLEPMVIDHFYRVVEGSNTSCGIALANRERTIVDFDEPDVPDPSGSRKMLLDAGLCTAQSTPLITRSGRTIGMISTHWRQHHRPSDRQLRFLDLLARQAADLIERRQSEIALQAATAEAQQRAQEAEAANRIKDEFLAVLSHELRSPLNPILGWAKLLRNGNLDATKTANALETIERNAQLQSQLIEDLLDISRILRGKLSLNHSSVDLRLVISSALETVRLAAEAKSLQLQTVFSPNQFAVLGDSGRLQQVVWNLLSNAVKFTPASGQITITLTHTETEAQIQVMDTGKGINPDFLPYVFEHFRQEDGATTRKFGGLGLGLAIARQIVEMHGGQIGVDSPGDGQGATFTVRLPLLSRTENRGLRTEDLALRPPHATPSTPLASLQILVVDDELDSRDFVVFVLEQAGAIVTSAASGIEAFQTIEQSAFNLIVSDIGMPEMDGYQLMQQIRSLHQGQQIPAIALTAYAGEYDRQQTIKAGFQQHLAKPVDPNQLIQTITRLLGSNTQ